MKPAMSRPAGGVYRREGRFRNPIEVVAVNKDDDQVSVTHSVITPARVCL